MEWVETVGKSVREAIEQALDELSVDESDAEIVIVEEPRSSLLGLRRSEARVRARVRPSSPRPKRPQRNRRTNERSGESRRRTRPALTDEAARLADSEEAAKSDGAKATHESSSDTPRGKTPVQTRKSTANKKRPERKQAASATTQAEEVQLTAEQQQELVGSFVRGVVERFGFDADTEVRADDEYIFIDVKGDDLGLLVGPRGSTLDAFQELSRTVIQRRSDEHAARVVLDVAGFRAKRAAALQGFVQRSAREVIESGQPQALEPMSPADRKIVHDTANAIEGVVTTSEGVDPRRYVVLRPADDLSTATDADMAADA